MAAAPLPIDTRQIASDHDHRTDANQHDHVLDINVTPGSLGAIVRSYKAAVARRVNRRRRSPGAQVWQRGYYEHIIRNDASLASIREYILANHVRWAGGREQLNALLARMEAKE